MVVAVRSIFIFFSFFFLSSQGFSVNDSPPPVHVKIPSSLEPQKEKFLEYLHNKDLQDFLGNSSNRVTHCPMKSGKLRDVVDRLIMISDILKNGKCKDSNQNFVNSLGQMTDKVALVTNMRNNIRGGVFDKYDGNLTSINLPSASTSSSSSSSDSDSDSKSKLSVNEWTLRTQALVNTLGQMSHKDDCEPELHRTGFLSVFGNIVSNMGMMALLIPSPNGIIAGSVALFLGASFNVLASLFVASYDWNNIQDRRQFMDLNCNFYDLRYELDKAEFFNSRDEFLEEKKKRGKELSKDFLKKLEEVKKNKKDILDSIDGLKNDHLKDRWTESLFYLYEHIENTQSFFKNEKEDGKLKNQAEFIINLLSLSQEIVSGLKDHKDVGGYYHEHLETLLKDFYPENMPLLSEMAVDVFHAKYYNPLKIYFKQLEEKIKKEKEKEIKIFMNDVENKESLEKIEKISEEILDAYEERYLELTQKIIVLESRDSKNVFATNNQGVGNSFDIIQEYERVIRLIYGKRGWHFADFLLKEIAANLAEFKKGYKKWKKNYFSSRDFMIGNEEWVCRDAQFLRVKWEKASSSVDMAYAFFETNKGIFHTQVKRYNTFFNFLPIGDSYERRLYQNAMSGEIAKKIIEGSSEFTSKDVQEDFGTLVLKLNKSETFRKEVDDLFKERSCSQYFYNEFAKEKGEEKDIKNSTEKTDKADKKE